MSLVIPRLYVIMDAALLKTSAEELAEALASTGVGLIQYRDKRSSARDLLETCRTLVSLLQKYDCRLVVNDRADVAALVGAGGVHVGQEDLRVEDARAVCGRDCWVGVSTHTLEQVRAADATSANYIAVGPVFATSTKKDPEPVVGVEFVRQARALTRKPLVAIGGITLQNAEAVWRAGADAVAVARDVVEAMDPGARAKGFLELAARLGLCRN